MPDWFAAVLGGLTFLIGVAGAVRAGVRLTRSDMAQTVEIQHTLWEETRTALADCHAEVARLRGS